MAQDVYCLCDGDDGDEDDLNDDNGSDRFF